MMETGISEEMVMHATDATMDSLQSGLGWLYYIACALAMTVLNLLLVGYTSCNTLFACMLYVNFGKWRAVRNRKNLTNFMVLILAIVIICSFIGNSISSFIVEKALFVTGAILVTLHTYSSLLIVEREDPESPLESCRRGSGYGTGMLSSSTYENLHFLISTALVLASSISLLFGSSFYIMYALVHAAWVTLVLDLMMFGFGGTFWRDDPSYRWVLTFSTFLLFWLYQAAVYSTGFAEASATIAILMMVAQMVVQIARHDGVIAHRRVVMFGNVARCPTDDIAECLAEQLYEGIANLGNNISDGPSGFATKFKLFTDRNYSVPVNSK